MKAILALVLAAAAPAGPEVFARNPQLQLDGEALVFSFDLGARSAAALAVRSVDFTVSIEGVTLFHGSAGGFDVPAGGEHAIALAGFGQSAALVEKLTSARYDYRVRGVLHGAAQDVPFAVGGSGATPDDVLYPRRAAQPAHSLLAY